MTDLDIGTIGVLAVWTLVVGNMGPFHSLFEEWLWYTVMLPFAIFLGVILYSFSDKWGVNNRLRGWLDQPVPFLVMKE